MIRSWNRHQSGHFVGAGVAEQTHQCLRNMAAILKAAGSDMSKVVKTTILLESMEDFKVVNGKRAHSLLVSLDVQY
jgi:enamine deaminase RidA (YjgF/YER057c/UK114 family)